MKYLIHYHYKVGGQTRFTWAWYPSSTKEELKTAIDALFRLDSTVVFDGIYEADSVVDIMHGSDGSLKF